MSITKRYSPSFASIRSHPALTLVSWHPFPDSPRNRFPAMVRRIERLGPITNIRLEVGGQELVASVTTATADDLASPRARP